MTSKLYKNLDFTKWKNTLFNINSIDDELIFGCGNGKLDIVKYVLTSPELSKHANIHYENEAALTMACSHGHIEIIDYLLNSTELEDHSSHDIFKLEIITKAVYDGQLSVIEYFLNHPKFESQAIKSFNNHTLSIAAGQGRLNIIKYILNNPQLKDFSDIHVHKDCPFRSACTNEEIDVIKYFIFDLNIEKSIHINNWLSSKKDAITLEIEQMFNIRDLNQNLNNELSLNKNIKNKVKL